MTHAHSTGTSRPGKVEKPYPDFPLYSHASGRWAKKIKGKLYYFGKTSDPWEDALEMYKKQADDLHAGRKPRERQLDGATIRDLCNAYWNSKKALMGSGELSPRTFIDCERTADLLIEHFGKARVVSDIGPDDFTDLRSKLAKRLAKVTLMVEIYRIRHVFRFALDNGLIKTPVLFGSNFKPPSAKTLRIERASKGKKLFTAAEIQLMLKGADAQLRAMILLAINCGFGNADCGTLPRSAVDLQRGWIDYPRPKTGVARRCPLWPETVKALKAVQATRPEATSDEDADLVFLMENGHRWAKASKDNPVSRDMRKLLDRLGIPGRTFYALRHTFQTQGDEAKDATATRFIMGHADTSISARYREDVSDERLKAVTDHVRAWLFGTATKAGKAVRHA